MRNFAIVVIIIASAVLAGLGVATVTVGEPAEAATAIAVTRNYSMPCYLQIREAHPEVPRAEDNRTAYLAWHSNPDNRTARDAYLEQVRQCKASHEARFGKWNWNSMVLVSISNN
jgi:hypothetical protein